MQCSRWAVVVAREWMLRELSREGEGGSADQQSEAKQALNRALSTGAGGCRGRQAGCDVLRRMQQPT